MPDQAADLRRLVLRGATLAPEAPPPQLIVVSGGKGGMGTTTIALNLALALARDGRRTLFVDADLSGGDAGTLCGIEATNTVVDVLEDRLSVHEALTLGPAGLQVLPGDWTGSRIVDCSERAQQRLLSQLRLLGSHLDYVVIDVGSGASIVTRRFWQAADQVLLVTSPEVVAVMDSYGVIKAMCPDGESPPLTSVVNFCPSAAVAGEVHQRLARACRRFLGVRLASQGDVPPSPEVSEAATHHRPLMIDRPESPAALAIEHLALTLTATSAEFSNNTSSNKASRSASSAA